MTIENRRSERIIDFLPLEVHVVDLNNGQVIAGPFSGRIIDISAHGACLLMTQIMHDGFHVFHSTRDADNTALRLTIDQPPDIDPCSLYRPARLDGRIPPAGDQGLQNGGGIHGRSRKKTDAGDSIGTSQKSGTTG